MILSIEKKIWLNGYPIHTVNGLVNRLTAVMIEGNDATITVENLFGDYITDIMFDNESIKQYQGRQFNEIQDWVVAMIEFEPGYDTED